MPAAQDLLLEAIQENLAMVAARHPIDELGETFEQLSIQLQALGCSKLLADMDQDGFRKSLIHDAFARRYFLRKSQQKGNGKDLHLAISRVGSIFSAIVAGVPALARELVALSPGEWLKDGEYADDFCYFHLIHRLVAGVDEAGLTGALARFEAAADGKGGARLTVAKAY